MGDNLKINKDKRHRSSSSIVGPSIEGTRSERKLDIRASILEVDDQFVLAEARCEDLQEKIDLVKGLKRKKKLKKRSTTRVTEPQPVEEVPFITVRTQPKRRPFQPSMRMRRLEAPTNPTRGYVDPAALEQHRMLGQVGNYNQAYRLQSQEASKVQDNGIGSVSVATLAKQRQQRRSRADGDSLFRRGSRPAAVAATVACGDDDVNDSSNHILCGARRSDELAARKVPNIEVRRPVKLPVINHRRHVPRDVPLKEANIEESQTPWRAGMIRTNRRNRPTSTVGQLETGQQADDRPVVELFYKNRSVHSGDLTRCNSRDHDTFVNEAVKEKEWRPRRIKYRSRRYELPTVASQMKQNSVRYYNQNLNSTAIPFIISKSTAPSHNIGVNIQQVLNGLKNQQPLSCIPLTIAHHMGLGHIPPYETKNVQPALDNREMNAIRLGQRLLRLPSYKYMSYNRLLALYRESEGMVSRFLRSIDRPHPFYASMYNLATRDDIECGTLASKSRVNKNYEAKQSLAAYASLYREYEQVERCLKENYDPELERRREELVRLLATREDHIRKVVHEYRASADTAAAPALRASASTAEDTYRFSTVRLHAADAPL